MSKENTLLVVLPNGSGTMSLEEVQRIVENRTKRVPIHIPPTVRDKFRLYRNGIKQEIEVKMVTDEFVTFEQRLAPPHLVINDGRRIGLTKFKTLTLPSFFNNYYKYAIPKE